MTYRAVLVGPPDQLAKLFIKEAVPVLIGLWNSLASACERLRHDRGMPRIFWRGGVLVMLLRALRSDKKRGLLPNFYATSIDEACAGFCAIKPWNVIIERTVHGRKSITCVLSITFRVSSPTLGTNKITANLRLQRQPFRLPPCPYLFAEHREATIQICRNYDSTQLLPSAARDTDRRT